MPTPTHSPLRPLADFCGRLDGDEAAHWDLLAGALAELADLAPGLVVRVADDEAEIVGCSVPEAPGPVEADLSRALAEAGPGDTLLSTRASALGLARGTAVFARIPHEGATLLVGGVPRDGAGSDAPGAARIEAAARIGVATIARSRQVAELRASNTRLDTLVDRGIALAAQPDVEKTLQALADEARVLLRARYSAIGVLSDDGATLSRFIVSGVDAATRAAIGDLPTGRGLLGELIRDPRPVRVASIAGHPRSVGFPPGHPQMESFLGVPVTLGDEVFGNLYVTDAVDGAFSAEDERLAQALAAAAAVALGNAMRADMQRRRLEEIQTVGRATEALLTTRRIEDLIPLLARAARRLTGARTIGVGVRLGGSVRFRYGHGPEALQLERLVVPEDPPPTDASIRATLADLAEDLDVRLVTLRAQDHEAGLLIALSDGPLDEGQLRLLRIFAGHAAIALANATEFEAERARLVELASVEAAQARADAAALSLRKTIEAQENERARIARELHDEAGQSLTALALAVLGAEEIVDDPEARIALREVREDVRHISDTLRALATDLRPSGLRERGLRSALVQLADRLTRATGIAVHVSTEGLPVEMAEDVEITLYRVVQEALTNVARHSGASEASVVISSDRSRLRVVIEDDGRGFGPEAPSGRLGLAGIRERVRLLGGDLRIESGAGSGAMLIVDLDLELGGR